MFAGKRPTTIGLQAHRLASCPSSPNCVCSYDSDDEHKIEPLHYTSTPAKAWAALKQTIGSLERTKTITVTTDYLYAEFASKLMGFVDDVEFYLDPASGVIQVRSASRLGQSDLGVNRQRIELIRSRLS